MSWHVYILQCADGSLYVGKSESVVERVAAHNRGEGAAWTKARRPVVLVYSEQASDELAATRRERQIKNWSVAKKRSLVSGDFKTLHSASRCYDVHGGTHATS